MLVLPIQVVVSSETTPGLTYQVQLPYCPCRDFKHRRADWNPDTDEIADYFCKHLITGIRTVGGHHAPASGQ
jgi:hypothetical protein